MTVSYDVRAVKPAPCTGICGEDRSRAPSESIVLRSCLVAFLTITFTAIPGLSEEWISPDGMVSVTTPSADRFQQMDDPPIGFLVLWESTDDTLYFGVVKSEIPPGTTLTQSAAEEELREETKGSVVASSTVVKNGREILLITVDVPGHGTTLQITQAIVQIGSNAYRAYAGAVDAEPSDRAVVDTFLNSFRIRQAGPGTESLPAARADADSATLPSAEQESAATPEAEPESEPQVEMINPAEWIGSLGVLLVVGLVIWWFAGRGGRTAWR